MPISAERFDAALRNLDPSQWRPFERLATVFLSSEFPSLRPVSAMSGDGGADALLFAVEDDPTVLVQFSVRKDVESKIRETCERIKTTFPNVFLLIYVTNQDIDGKSIELRRNVRTKHKLHLDPRGREWLVTVRNATTANMAEAEELAQKVVDPLVSSSGEVLKQQAQALEDLEAKAAFVYLGLQWADDTREKGLTKLSFEALVRSVLRDTTSDERKSRSEIYELVQELLPGHHTPTLKAQVDGALKRLSKRFIRHWKKPDEFCLTWDERVRLSARLTELDALDATLRRHLQEAIETSAAEIDIRIDNTATDSLVETCRAVIERVLLDRGEGFAAAVTHDRGGDVHPADIEAVVSKIVAEQRKELALPLHVIAATLQAILVSPPDDVRRYLRSLADTYTLFAFMRETPDVQSAVTKLFSEGDIWLDTSVVLPLLAEELLEPEERSHTQLIAAAVECGLELHITDGVLEELVTHVRRCESYLRALTRDGARGAPPFLLAAHRAAGHPDDELSTWLQNFCGADPDYDLLEYLEDEHSITHHPLTEVAARAPVELRGVVAEVFYSHREAREQRLSRLGIPAPDPLTRDKLVNHDVENYVGVVQRRAERNERRSAFGYKSWWLTLDRGAFKAHEKLRQDYSDRPPASPSISPDFMLNYLAIGPIRNKLSKKSESTLPLMLNMSVLDVVPPALLELADQLRKELQGMPPRIVRRKIRETMEDAKRLLGPTARAGELGLTDDVKARLIAAAKIR